MKINERGYWENNTLEGHGVDRSLARGLVNFFKQEYYDFEENSKIFILDIGCGNGFYTKLLNDQSELVCDGYDGNPYTPEITNGLCKVADFSKRIDFENIPVYDWVLCLEVGEHIPAEFEDDFIWNICEREI